MCVLLTYSVTDKNVCPTNLLPEYPELRHIHLPQGRSFDRRSLTLQRTIAGKPIMRDVVPSGGIRRFLKRLHTMEVLPARQIARNNDRMINVENGERTQQICTCRLVFRGGFVGNFGAHDAKWP